ncbi:pentatricopeptide repeat-containing protein At3g07290, mitochondrial-like [Amaranthus tricolor]|uniref:pentatricopeptide repeat-containing protein At3g07290, mitochondrial-like n=1 Tax=Amaranthus tricolor TaxID=29722 RepID=UPI002586FA06|nr:pentatricopeptide repeat-containing protein At3g07290, mitochondrial-like [Amaranthus tricolor]XP_057531936.1 pentatricopeptide repeat-containing protein At3g07290, mitochondrial-like [Amaranthus tricolor]
MGLLQSSKRSRHGSIPFCNHWKLIFLLSDTAYPSIYTHHFFSKTGYPLLRQSFCSISSKSSFSWGVSNRSNSNIQSESNLLGSYRFSNQYLSCSTQFFRFNFSSQLFSRSCINSSAKTYDKTVDNEDLIVDINSLIFNVIKGDGIDMESNLNSISPILSKSCIIQIIRCLNFSKVPALRFFKWLKNSHSTHCRNSDICSLVFANCHLLGDHANLLNLLKDFRNQQICLSEKAFSFLPITNSSLGTAEKSVSEIVELLTEIGGSCSNSGIHSLIEMLCSLNFIDLAKYVVRITERKVSYYNIFVRHMCRRGQFREVQDLIEEMKQMRCDPDAKTYNYMISGLCKRGRIDEALSVFEEMQDGGCSPNLHTFEILILFCCRYGRSDHVLMLDNKMVSIGLEPCLSTHYAFIRGYFHAGQFDEAYRYVSDVSENDRCVAREVYSVLASLHLNDGHLHVAHKLLDEMLGKGIKPEHSICLRVTSRLCKIGKANLAGKLKVLYDGHNAG